VPLENESPYPQGTFDLQESLAARMQCAGRFEVVLASPDTHLACRDAVRLNGRFDEAELVELADEHNADAVLFGAITQYQPYAPPRVGLSLRLVSPATGALIASVDGLWDARDRSVADQARWYTALVLNNGQSLTGCDLALESPALFRRFACHQAVDALVSPVQTPATSAPPGQFAPAAQPVAPVQPAEAYPPPVLPPPIPAPPAPSDAPHHQAPTLPALQFDPVEPAPLNGPMP
jgi:hypothetical protein